MCFKKISDEKMILVGEGAIQTLKYKEKTLVSQTTF